jgi:hypothetical protein
MADDAVPTGGYRSFADNEKVTFSGSIRGARSERVPVGMWHAGEVDADETLCGIDLYRVFEFDPGRFESARPCPGTGQPSATTSDQWRCPECHARAGLD